MKQRDSIFQHSTLPFILIIVAIFFLAEMAEMFIFPMLPVANEIYNSILESMLMTIVALPFFWWFITKRKRAEEALRESEKRYRTLAEAAHDIIFIINRDGYVQYVNNFAAKQFECLPGDIIGKKRKELFPPEISDRQERNLQRVFETDEALYVEESALFPTSEIWLGTWLVPLTKEAGEVDAVLGISRDITKRKRAEEALEMALQDWQYTFEAISDSILILDSEGRVIKSNRVLENMLGINTEDVIGQYCYKTIHCTSNHIENCPFERMMRTGKRESLELEDKERGLWLHVTVDPMRDDTGKIKNVVHIVRNITEIKKAEELRLENERLAYASRAKSEFLANMSHELRTPLNSIIGFSDLLKQKMAGELNEKQERYVDNIFKSSKRLLSLIRDILDLSKVEAGKMELVFAKLSVPEIINESIILIKEKAAKHNVVIRKELDPELEFLEADKVRFKQVLFNLLSNAVKFSKKEGGTVTIATKKEVDLARISVTDTGIGIRGEDMGKLFKTFEQLDSGISRNYGGTGLGLSISKKLVELHGGKIWAESKYGEGSTFTFLIPIIAKKIGENI